MALSAEQYMALSAIAYTTELTHGYRGKLMKDLEFKDEDTAKTAALSSLNSWTFVDYTSTPSGFAAIALQAPDNADGTPGEIVFAFRGTEPFSDWGADITNADAQIAIQDSIDDLPAQFNHAQTFVTSVLSVNSGAPYSFTGHSLGGGIAAYMTYATNTDGIAGVGKAVTFNAPGIAGLIAGGVNVHAYDNLVTDYVNANDIIGEFSPANQLGTTVYLQSRLSSTFIGDVGAFAGAISAANNPLMNPLDKIAALVNAGDETWRVMQGVNPFSYHDLGDMLNSNNQLMNGANGSNVTAGSAVAGYIAQGTYQVGSGAKFAIVTIGGTLGGLIYYGAEGTAKFINTSGHIINQLIYTGADGVQKFIDTSGYIVGGIGHYAIQGVSEFFETTGNILGEGIWNMSVFARDSFTSALDGIFGLFNSAATTTVPFWIDPLILDIDGDGIETTNLVGSSAYFDLDVNGFAERTGWVSADDGLLVLDRNNNGTIDNGQELFGDRTLLQNGTTAATGFQALAEFDTNADGKIDVSDSAFSLLRIWQDLNSDGVSTASELKTLTAAGVQSISLSSIATGVTDVMSNIQRRLGSFIRSDGSNGLVGEYLLNRDVRSTQMAGSNTTVPTDILALPNLQGAGNVASLHVAMANDTTGQLKVLVQDFIAAPTAAARNALVAQIIYKWAGVEAIDPASRGSTIDARQLAALEKFLGTAYVGVNGGSPNTSAAPILQAAYANLSEYIYGGLTSRTVYQALISEIDYTTTAQGVEIDLSAVQTIIETAIQTNYANGVDLLKEFSRMMTAYELRSLDGFKDFRSHFVQQSAEFGAAIDVFGADSFMGDTANNTLQGTARNELFAASSGNDYIAAGAGNDTVYGGEGNDGLDGADGNDLLDGGTGNDGLYGGYGNDTYVFRRGGGQDVISEYNGSDKIEFGANILPSDIVVSRAATYGADLVLTIAGTTDTLTITQFFGQPNVYSGNLSATDTFKVEQFVFTNGTTWDVAAVLEKARILTGTSGNDNLGGFADQNDLAYGAGGSDSISTHAGNDLLDGGNGNDYLAAGAGDDALYGGEGNDTLDASDGNDLIDGGVGNDSAYGSFGSDTYIFRLGDGQDTIDDYTGADKIVFGAGILPADVQVSRTGGYGMHLVLSIVGTTDQITVNQFFGQSGYDSLWQTDAFKVEQLIFADGTTWDVATVLEKARNLNGTNGNDHISGFADQNDIAHGLDGSDSINTSAGNDLLDGGNGNDYLAAGTGNDTLYGGTGNDSLDASDGNDLMDGGTGNDTLYGGYGDDTIIFRLGDGQDVIEEYTGNDKIEFGAGILPSDIVVGRSGGYGENLVLSIAGTTDTLTVNRFFGQPNNYYGTLSVTDVFQVEQFIFANGTIWDVATVIEKARTINGSEAGENIYGYNDTADVIYGLAGNDALTGRAGNDELYGGTGNDSLDAGDGNDLLDGGTGNDNLHGGYGNDTYVFGRGDGEDAIWDYQGGVNADKITFGTDVVPADIAVSRSGNYGEHLVLAITGTTDKLTINNYFGHVSNWVLQLSNDYKIEQFTFANGTIWDTATVLEKARTVLGTEGNDTALYGYEDQADIVRGFGGNDSIWTYGGNDYIEAGDGVDSVSAGGGNDTVYAGAGNDSINGSDGNDLLNGGTGNDNVYGGYGNDTYIFNAGDGQDVVTDYTGADKVEFGVGILPADITVSRSGNYGEHLVIAFANGTDKLTINNYFGYVSNWALQPASEYKIEEFTFANGTAWDTAAILEKARTVVGTEGSDNALVGYDDQADIVYGFGGNDAIWTYNGNDYVEAGAGDDSISAGQGNDVLYGNAGNDSIDGSDGNDLIDGGAGNDNIYGGYGNDTYIFRLGDGQDIVSDYTGADKIEFGTGILPANVQASRGGNYGEHLVLKIASTTDQVTVNNYFGYVSNWALQAANEYKIEQFTFADGTIWDTATVLEKARTVLGSESGEGLQGYDDQADIVYGFGGNDSVWTYNGNDYVEAGAGDDSISAGQGNDTLYGNAGNDSIDASEGNDLIDGGTGNDNVYGGYGNDTYMFRLGDGQDVISEYTGSDKIEFGTGILPANVQVSRAGNYGEHLVFKIAGTTDQVTFNNYFGYATYWALQPSNDYKIEQFTFADGTTWDTSIVLEKARTVLGTNASEGLYGYDDQADIVYGFDGGDSIATYNGNDYVEAGADDDSISAGQGNDTVYGNAGNDSIDGSDGNDLLNGGTGNDYLYGGYGNDTFVFSAGDGSDTIAEADGNDDKVITGMSVASMIFARNGNNLNVTSAGSTDALTVNSWYSNQAYQVEQFKAADGSTISNTQIDQLIQAMASFSTNNNGITWGQALQDRPSDVQAVLSQYWTAPTA